LFSDFLDLDGVAEASAEDLVFIPNHTFCLGPATVDSEEKSHGGISIMGIFCDIPRGLLARAEPER